MTMDRLKTGSGKQLRTAALAVVQVPVPYVAAAMPGAIVLGSNGRLNASVFTEAGLYGWSQIWTSNRNQLIRLDRNDATPATIFLEKQRSDASLAVVNDNIGSINFEARNQSGLTAQCGSVNVFVDSPTSPDTISAAMRFSYRPLALAGSIPNLPVGLIISSSGNVLINNTSGTERLSVTGNIQLTNTADSYRVGTNNVVGSRKTGWGLPTGTATRTAFATSTATVTQLAERVKALIDDLTSHGLIGA
jgi:hypothetical protein